MNHVIEQIDANILTLTFNRPTSRNAITPEMYSCLEAALSRAENDSALHVILIQGDQRSFTAGSDIQNLRDGPPALEESSVVQFSLRIAECSKPVVAAVCGHAVGIGATMLLHCDLVIAGSNARFRLPFVDLGICPEAASSLLLPQIIGHQRAAELFLLGDTFDAQAALALGLVNRVVDPREVNDLALEWARRIAQKPLSSLIETKRLMKQRQAVATRDRILEETHLIARLLQEPAAKRAFTAFLEK